MLNIILFVLFMSFQVADVVTTNEVLSKGGREVNPIAAWMMAQFGKHWWVPKVIIAIVAGVILAKMGPPGAAGLGVVNLAYGLILANNLYQAGK